jgi:hypothetical protein
LLSSWAWGEIAECRHANVEEYRHRAEECLKLGTEVQETYAKMALLELAAEFRAKAQQLELRVRRTKRQTNA